MPEQYTVEVRAKNLQVGDAYHGNHQKTSKIITYLDKKSKFTYVYFTDDAIARASERPLRIEHDATVWVARTRLTAEEQKAAVLRTQLERLDYAEQGAVEDLEKIRSKTIGILTDGGRLDHWEVEALLMAQANAELWAKVAHVHKLYAQRTEEDLEEMRARSGGLYANDVRGPMTRLEALDFVLKKTEERLIEQVRFTSRSSSIVSNVCEDVSRQAAADFLNNRR